MAGHPANTNNALLDMAGRAEEQKFPVRPHFFLFFILSPI